MQIKSLLSEILNISLQNGFHYLCCHFYSLNNTHKKIRFQRHYKILNRKMQLLGASWRENAIYPQDLLGWRYLLFKPWHCFLRNFRAGNNKILSLRKMQFYSDGFSNSIFLQRKNTLLLNAVHYCSPRNAKNGMKQERMIISTLTAILSTLCH